MIKNILNLIPTIIGMVQSLLPLLKELAVTVVRIIGILPFLWDCPEPLIEKINAIYQKIYDWVERIKTFLLFIK